MYRSIKLWQTIDQICIPSLSNILLAVLHKKGCIDKNEFEIYAGTNLYVLQKCIDHTVWLMYISMKCIRIGIFSKWCTWHSFKPGFSAHTTASYWFFELVLSFRMIPSLNTQSCNRRPLCSKFTFGNVGSPKKTSFIPKKIRKK